MTATSAKPVTLGPCITLSTPPTATTHSRRHREPVIASEGSWKNGAKSSRRYVGNFKRFDRSSRMPSLVRAMMPRNLADASVYTTLAHPLLPRLWWKCRLALRMTFPRQPDLTSLFPRTTSTPIIQSRKRHQIAL
ncbi:hypothetical protein EDB89DRAFT_2247740 [Lactarius sanguifluus]|nr:hypothetical protein EDB89DRAFT_2247740 [Lactarius sanguifluus]